MSVTSLSFFLFICAVTVLYFVLPRKFQWILLLVASGVFYLSFGVKCAVYVFITATSIYFATCWMQSIADRQSVYLKENKSALSKEEKKAYKAKNKTTRKWIMVCTLLLNLGILCFFKYFHFALEQVNAVISLFGSAQITDRYFFLIPLGISFYTFQSVGYLVDVYWENCTAEKNYFKVLLFVSFFPQMTQGPISEYDQLSKELFAEHSFDSKNYIWGAQRMIWGFFKKIVIADTAAVFVRSVFENYPNYSGITVFLGALTYSLQIYADFSGYMDIMCGFCEILGIRLTENFERPYFSKSIAEYWRRWHISLGAWFKKYIYYPIGMSGWSRKLAKNCKQKFGKHLGDTIPATIALIVVWTATGLWHGASWAYIAWGFVNGLFIILSLWMEPVYDGWKQRLHIQENTFAWRAFQTIRTFILVTFIKVLPEVGTLSQGFGLWRQIFVNHTIPHSMHQLFPDIQIIKVALILAGALILFITSLIQRRRPVRAVVNHWPMILRTLVFTVMVVAILYYGSSGTVGGFLYANF